MALLILLPLALSTQGATQAAGSGFASTAFSSLWERTDALVAAGDVRRTWLWGPQPNSMGIYEEYKEGAGGKRLVQYFDKSRMEINNPSGNQNDPFFVTNGLLTIELISGQMQTGNNSFEQRQPSRTNVTGDFGDPLAPTYAELAPVSSAGREKRDPNRTGQPATSTLGRDGKVGNEPAKSSVPGVKIAYYEKTIGHNVPQAMWDFLNSTGLISIGGELHEGRLIEPWFYAAGLPISDPYWVRATIAGKATDVLVQAYERRVLTYVPANPEGFRVEMGNVGQHYYRWRYDGAGTPVPAPTHVASTPTPTSQPIATLSRYAVELNGDGSARTLDMVKASGAGAVRLYMSWASLEPTNVAPAEYNWAGYDSHFKAVADRGLQPIVLVENCPRWACPRSAGPLNVERVDDFAQFMGAVAARYGKPPYNAHYWEFWNEPDATTTGEVKYNWGTYGARYASMLAAVRPSMKAADPAAQLVLGGIAYDNFLEDGGPFYRRFVDDLLEAGGGKYLDAFNFHYYIQNVHWCGFKEKLQELRGKLSAHGLNLPMLATETGFTSDPAFASSDSMQSLYVAQVYGQTAGEGMLSTAWYTIQDYTSPNPGGQIFASSGLLDLNGAAKPSYQAYKVAVAQIGRRPGARSLTVADGVAGAMRGYEFASDASHSGRLWMVWAWDLNGNPGACGATPAPRDFAIPASKASGVRRVLDMHGQPVPTSIRSDGRLVFSLDARPVYVEWTP
jgi:hypothetical protein